MKSLSMVNFKTTKDVKKLRFILSPGKLLNRMLGFNDKVSICFFSLKILSITLYLVHTSCDNPSLLELDAGKEIDM